jgi:Thioesterase-like superfamily
MAGFDEATAVRRGAEGRYEAVLDADYGFEEALNGGYLIATMLRAAIDASPHPHPVASSANFLRVAKPGRAELVIEPLKSGRTVAVARVTLVQDDRAVVEMTATSGTLSDDSEPDWVGERAARPSIEDCVAFDFGRPKQGFAGQVEMRFDAATTGWLDGRPSGAPEMRAYFRLREGREPDAFALALAVDALPPVVLNVGARGWAPTVELTWHMRAVPAPGWLYLHGQGRLVNDGWFDEDVEVWDSAGRLVAQSRQIARSGRS